jgi:hypothetical protein
MVRELVRELGSDLNFPRRSLWNQSERVAFSSPIFT